jgi:hypothetical protein
VHPIGSDSPDRVGTLIAVTALFTRAKRGTITRSIPDRLRDSVRREGRSVDVGASESTRSFVACLLLALQL